MSWGVVVQTVVTGLAAGAAYGLVAAGFVLVFRLTGILHFAHGDLLGVALFVGLQVAGRAWAGTASVAVVAASLFGAVLYAVLLRPAFRRGAAGQWVAITVAVAFVVQAALALAFPRAAYILPDVVAFEQWAPFELGGGATVHPRSLFVIAAGVLVGLVADLVLTRTRFGLGLQAVADDAVAASLVGVPVDRLVTGAFALAGVLGAVAGLVIVPATTLAPATGLLLGLKGIAAALLVGLRSPRLAFAGGLGVGMIEAAAVSLDAPAWRDVAPIVVVLAALAWRPPALATERPE